MIKTAIRIQAITATNIGTDNSVPKTLPAIWHIDPLLRVADLYLMYAEAVNEAYGPSGTAENYPLTAREAFDIVRKRTGMPRVKSTVGQEEFRLRIQNERCVELAYEGHHYYY